MPTCPGNESPADVDDRQPEPFQFSIRWLLGLTAVVAAVFGIAKWSGVGLSMFFLGLYFAAYFFGPFTIWAATRLCPSANRRHRRWVGAAVAVFLILPILSTAIGVKAVMDASPLPPMGLDTVFVFLPGTALLWSLQFFFIVSLIGPRRETDELPRSVFERETDEADRNDSV